MNTKETQEQVEELMDILHKYGAYLLNHPKSEPLERRGMKHALATDFLRNALTLAEQRGAERERERIVEKLAQFNPQYDDKITWAVWNEILPALKKDDE